MRVLWGDGLMYMNSPRSTMPRQPRVEVDPKVYKALCAEALLQDKSPKELVRDWIISNLSPQARDFMGSRAQHQDSPTGGPTDAAHRRLLAKDQAALAKIKELWDSGEHNAAEIAKKVGYPRSTTHANIQKMLQAGELQPSRSPPEAEEGS
jgi:hypothetical protein